jgi:hypothetical protein
MIETLRWLTNPMRADGALRRRNLIQLAGAILLPYLLLATYLTATRLGMGATGNAADTGALLVGLMIGAVIMWLSPMPLKIRIVLLVAYLPSMYYGLSVFTLAFVGYVFGHWL